MLGRRCSLHMFTYPGVIHKSKGLKDLYVCRVKGKKNRLPAKRTKVPLVLVIPSARRKYWKRRWHTGRWALRNASFRTRIPRPDNMSFHCEGKYTEFLISQGPGGHTAPSFLGEDNCGVQFSGMKETKEKDGIGHEKQS